MLTWENVRQAASYGIEVSPNAAFNPVIVHIDNYQDTSILVRGLENNKRYFWRVRSANADATGVYGERSSFVTGVLTNVAEQREGVIVGPNPMSTTCRVTSPELIGSTIHMYTSDGKLVRAIESATQSLSIDVADLPNGAYTLVISRGGRTIVHYSLTKIQ
jgi:hypothetical protein